MTDPVLALARDLVARRSVTPEDAGCQAVLAERLARLGFQIRHLPFGPVHNLWARYGERSPLFVFAGHTDVVPPGDEAAWRFPPFAAQVEDGMLHGRGTADMKGSLAAMVVAVERFLARCPRPAGSIAFLITSDEEGDAVDGTVQVVRWLAQQGTRIDWCLVGEPSSSERLGDVVKHGRRGSLSGRLRVHGIQGHVAYPQLADNPVHRALPVLARLCAETWDQGNADFPPTSFQISNIHAGTGAGNVIPGELEVAFNFRYSTETTAADLERRVGALLDAAGLDYSLDWTRSGDPFLTRDGRLVAAVRAAVAEHTGSPPALSTAGGTSDGRFIAPTGAEVVELGPVNTTIHKVDERVAVADLQALAAIHERLLEKLLC